MVQDSEAVFVRQLSLSVSWSRHFGEEREDVILVTFPLDLRSETRS